MPYQTVVYLVIIGVYYQTLKRPNVPKQTLYIIIILIKAYEKAFHFFLLTVKVIYYMYRTFFVVYKINFVSNFIMQLWLNNKIVYTRTLIMLN